MTRMILHFDSFSLSFTYFINSSDFDINKTFIRGFLLNLKTLTVLYDLVLFISQHL